MSKLVNYHISATITLKYAPQKNKTFRPKHN